MRRAGAALALCAALAGPAASGPVDEAREAARDLRAAVASLEGAGGGEERIAAITSTIRAMEDGLSALRESMRRIAARAARSEALLAAREERLGSLLATLARMERVPTGSLALHPDGPLETVRAGMLAAGAVPALRAEARALRGEIEEIAAIRALQDDAAGEMQAGIDGLRAARAALAEALRERREAPSLGGEPERLAALAASAATLEGFAARIAPSEGLPADIPKGELAPPAAGTLLRAYLEPDGAGIARPGAILATAPAALVAAPFPASVRYAGPLPGYDNVIVLEPEAGSLVVLGGLGSVYVESGRIVRAGDPLGLMGGVPPSGAEMAELAARGAGAHAGETLYIETREMGEPVDPRGWFAF